MQPPDTDNPQFAFIIVSYNTLALTRAAILSIQQHAPPHSAEIIVVDNHSTDGTVETLRGEFPDVQLLAREDNAGYASACNDGAKLACASWLVLMNSDAELLPETIGEVDRLLKAHPEIKILGGQLLNTDRTLQSSVQLEKNRHRFEQRNQHVELAQVDGVVGAFMIIRHDLWRKLQGMDENFFFYFEESDFCRRARDAGAFIGWSPRIRVLHHLASSVSVAGAKLRAKIEYWRSSYYYRRKHLSAWQFYRSCLHTIVRLSFNLIGHILGCIFTLGLSKRVRNRLRVYAHVMLWHLRGCPADWGFRRPQ